VGVSFPSLNIINALLDSFINTTAGWINLLLMSSSGPVKIPVGAW
jgi:3-oxoacyl-(acyl-carrier-protein) synthase